MRLINNLLPFQSETIASQRIRKLLSFALIIGLLQTFSFTYQLVQAPPSNATLPTTFNPADSGTVTIPIGIWSIEVDLEGGGAGTGGKDGTSGNTNTQPGGRGKVIASVGTSAGDVIGIFPGRAGSNGANDATNSGGGAGGISTFRSEFNGGRGGDAGSNGSSGAGGGGGAASVLTRNGTIMTVAGGAGGGGGNANFSSNTGQNGKDDDNAVNTSNTGGAGQKTTAANSPVSNPSPLCAVNTNDGGGGGGGGGGYTETLYGGGAGGRVITGTSTECAGDGGNRGKNYFHNSVGIVSDTVLTTNKSNNGIIRIKYKLETLNVSQSATPNTLGSISVSWSANNYASGYQVNLYTPGFGTLLDTKTVGVGTTSTTITSADYPELAHSTSYTVGVISLGDNVTYLDSIAFGGSIQTVTTNSPAAIDPKIDSALEFDGIGNEILYASSNSLNQIPETFTAEAWIYPTSYACTGGSSSPWSTNDANCHVVSKGNHFSLLLKSSSTTGSAGETSGQLGFLWSGTAKYSRYTIPLNEWHHIAFSREGSGASATKLYVDGNLVYEDTTTANAANTTRDFSIGASRSDGTSTNDIYGKFIGQIDEVKLSTRFRTQAEIRDDLRLHNNENSVFRLYYDFNENSGTTAFNRITGSAVGTDLTIAGASFSSSKIYTIDTTTVSAYTIVTFFRTFLVSANGWTSPSDRRNIRYLVVGGGGGGGGGYNAGGGGAGGYREANRSLESNTVFSIEVGPGGIGALGKYAPTNGTASAIRNYSSPTDSITASGGGRGATEQQAINGPYALTSPDGTPNSGGSGGGGSHGATNSGLSGGSGNVGGFNPVEGYAGGSGASGAGWYVGGGGGGAGGAGTSATSGTNGSPGNGGVGVTTTITGVSIDLAGGGAGAGRFVPSAAVVVKHGTASHGGGSGACANIPCATNTDTGTAGTKNTGGGGGAGTSELGIASGGSGGSGFVVIRYITDKPVILSQPQSDTVTVGALETFTVTTNAAPAPLTKSVQWQFTADTTTVLVANITGWTNVSTGSGSTTDTFTTGTLTLAMNKYRYRVIITFSDTSSLSISETSSVVTLTINNSITLTVDSSTITRKYGAAQSTRSITFTGGTAPFRVTTPNRQLANGRIYVDTSTATAVFRVDTGTAVGTYTETVTVTDNFGISATYTQRVVVNPADTLTVQADTLTAITYNPAGMSINPTVTITGLVNSDTRSSITINYSATGSNCASGGTCTEGDTGPGGGIVFKVIGSTYYEAAPKTWYSTFTYNGSSYSNSTVVYCANASNTKIDPYNPPSNTSNTGWGGGKTNTDAFRAHCAKGAVGLVGTYSGGSKTDWYIPNATEMNGLQTYWNNRSALSTQFVSTVSKYFWTSDASYNATWGWLLTQPYFDANGIWQTAGAAYNHQGGLILPIRSFTIDGAAQPALTSTSTAPTNAGTFTLTPSALVLANNVDTSNYVSVVYRTSTFTINKARQDTLTVASVLGVYETGTATIQLTTLGGTDTGTVTYTIATGGTASGCSVSSNILSVTSAGTCRLAATKAATLNYLIAYSDTATITFSRFVSRPLQVQLYPSMIPLNQGNALETNSVAASTLLVSSITRTGAGAYTITGTGFSNIELVRIGGTDLTGSNYTVGSVTSITLTGVSSLMGPLFIRRTDGQEAVNFQVTWN